VDRRLSASGDDPPPEGAAPVEEWPPRSFQAVYDEHAAFVWRSLRRLGLSGADLDDAYQDAFIVVHRKLESFAGQSPRAWLFGICLRVAAQHRRRAHRQKEVPQASVPEGLALPTQDEATARSQARALLDVILDELGADQRAVFILYELEGFSMAEVSQSLGCRLQTAYSRLHAARRLVEAGIARRRAREERS
jgi:RNA polymerase sigma-70 factor, ECF subfamily